MRSHDDQIRLPALRLSQDEIRRLAADRFDQH